MSNKKRTVLTVLALVLVCALSIAGTLAYLADYSSGVKNTFVVANVASLDLYESEAENDPEQGWILKDGTKVYANTYSDLIPGTELLKDPKVEVGPTKAPLYVFVKVTEKPEGISWDWNTAWYEVPGVADVRYQEVPINNSDDPTIYPVLAGNKVDVDADFANKTGTNLAFEAYLIQQEGFASPAAAWAEAAKENPNN